MFLILYVSSRGAFFCCKRLLVLSKIQSCLVFCVPVCFLFFRFKHIRSRNCRGAASALFLVFVCCDSNGRICCYLGWSQIWRWQQHGPRKAYTSTTDSSIQEGICGPFGQWICCYLGWSRHWWGQQWRPRTVERSLSTWSIIWSFWGNLGRWQCRCVGRHRYRWRL